MKIKNKNFTLSYLLLSVLLISSCRTELDEFVDTQGNTALKLNSNVANLILRASMNDGAVDNILDKCDCFSIQLPVTVVLEEETILISSQEDYELIEAYYTDNDIKEDVSFQFPIQIIQRDFTVNTVDNPTVLKRYKNSCGNSKKIINCTDFEYPFDLKVFNKSSENLRTIKVTYDQQLYKFVEALHTNVVVTISFPITLTLTNGEGFSINSLESLEDSLNNIAMTCESAMALSIADVQEYMLNDLFEISKYKDDASNETSDFENYSFDFNENGAVLITEENYGDDDGDDDDDDDKSSTKDSINGKWFVFNTTKGELAVRLNFGTGAPLSKLNRTWIVKKLQENKLMLRNYVQNEVSKDELNFKKK